MTSDKPTRRSLLTTIAAATTISIAGCSGESDDGSSDSTASGSADEGNNSSSGSNGSEEEDESSSDGDEENDGLTILEHELTEGDLGPEVVGEVENTTGSDQDYIQVSAQFYDEEGTRIDEWLDNAEDVADGEVVAFTITATTDAEVSEYEITASTSAI